VLTSSIDEAIVVSDKIAPEHLEIQTRDAKEVSVWMDQSLPTQKALWGGGMEGWTCVSNDPR
jgi:hypothetical protein